jgi:hypothetical protein
MEWKRLSQRKTRHRIAANYDDSVMFLHTINDRLLRGTRRWLSRRWQAYNMYWMRLRRAVTLMPLSRPGALCGRRWQAIKRRFQSFSGRAYHDGRGQQDQVEAAPMPIAGRLQTAPRIAVSP